MKITKELLKQIIKEEIQRTLKEQKAVAKYEGYEYIGLFSKLDEKGMQPEEHERYADVWKSDNDDPSKPYALYKLRESEFQRSIENPTEMTEAYYDRVIPPKQGGKCTDQCWTIFR